MTIYRLYNVILNYGSACWCSCEVTLVSSLTCMYVVCGDSRIIPKGVKSMSGIRNMAESFTSLVMGAGAASPSQYTCWFSPSLAMKFAEYRGTNGFLRSEKT